MPLQSGPPFPARGRLGVPEGGAQGSVPTDVSQELTGHRLLPAVWAPGGPRGLPQLSPPRPHAATLLQVSERRLRPLPQKQRTLHEKILEEIKQERRLRPVGAERWGGRGFGSLPCILNACSGDSKSTSCINLSVTDAGSCAQRPRPRVLLKAPTLAEMEEMNTSEVRPHRLLRRHQGGQEGLEVRGG